jgi:hypothetical protein
MKPAHGISRSFPLLTLAMAVPLVAILAFVAYDRYVKDDAPGDGWKTYRDERFKYEIRFPSTWNLDRDDGGQLTPELTTRYTSFLDSTVPTPNLTTPQSGMYPARFPTKAVVWVNPQGDWCLQRVTETEIIVDGVVGKELTCYWYGINVENCVPQPKCREQPLGLMRIFDRGGDKFWVLADIGPYRNDRMAEEFDVARRVVQSFRFTD